jgi:nitrite reductase/ring-hydroxylating ferredoxin subunit
VLCNRKDQQVPGDAQTTADHLVALCAAADVVADAPARVALGNEAYAVFNLDGEFYATQDHCTHGPGSLSEGFVIGTEIECPFHQGRFDIRTGKPTAAPCIQALRIWTVHVIDGRLFIDPAEHRGEGSPG